MTQQSPVPLCNEPQSLSPLQIKLLAHEELERFNQLLDEHHYLKRLQPVGERLYYVATDAQGQWLALLVFNAAAKHLKHRDQWIGWSAAQRHWRLALVVNNSRFLILPGPSVPNLGSQVLRLALERLRADWQARYGHPVLIVESFVDPEKFCGTVYTANGWVEVGSTDGWGRCRRDYYVKHDQPKRLFVRELCRQARRQLQAETLKPELAAVQAKVPPRCPCKAKELASIAEQFKAVPDFRRRFESYPVWSLLTMMLLATVCEAPRGQKDLSKFAKGFSQAQRRQLGIRRQRQGRYPAPSQSTFCRFLQGVNPERVQAAILAVQEKMRGPAPPEELIVLDGKEPNHGSGHSVLTAVTVPSQYYLGSALVDQKTNEIPVARELFEQLDLAGRLVSLDALHTQTETARALVLEAGADYTFTVKDNQPTVRQNIQKLVSAPQADFPPSISHGHASAHAGRRQQKPAGEPFHSNQDLGG